MMESENEAPSVRNDAEGHAHLRLRKRISCIVFHKGIVSEMELFGIWYRSQRPISLPHLYFKIEIKMLRLSKKSGALTQFQEMPRH